MKLGVFWTELALALERDWGLPRPVLCTQRAALQARDPAEGDRARNAQMSEITRLSACSRRSGTGRQHVGKRLRSYPVVCRKLQASQDYILLRNGPISNRSRSKPPLRVAADLIHEVLNQQHLAAA
jgi:hypothetical protein